FEGNASAPPLACIRVDVPPPEKLPVTFLDVDVTRGEPPEQPRDIPEMGTTVGNGLLTWCRSGPPPFRRSGAQALSRAITVKSILTALACCGCPVSRAASAASSLSPARKPIPYAST